MKSLSRENQADITKALNSTSRYRDDLLDIDNIHFKQMIDRIDPVERQTNKAIFFRYRSAVFRFEFYISNGTISTKMCDKRDDFDFDIVKFPFRDGDVPRRTSYGVNTAYLFH